jgi:Kef-type K+ transport system membrane component KefB
LTPVKARQIRRANLDRRMELHFALLSIGALFAVGLAADVLGRRTHVPRVTLLMLIGLLIGPSALDMLPAQIERWYEFLAAAALTMVAFLLGGALSFRRLKRHGREILILSAVIVAASSAVVGGGLWLAGVPLTLALLLAGIAAATDPAATLDVVRQSGAKGRFPGLLLGIVAVDDAWGLIAFSLLLVAAKALNGHGMSEVLVSGLWEIGGAILCGALTGVPAAALTGRLRPGEPMQIEALAVVFLCAGIAIWAGVSYLLAGMACGVAVSNLARHHDRPFHEIESIEWPFMVLFFILAGASLRMDGLNGLGAVIGLYLTLRIAARILGGWAGGGLARVPQRERRWLGVALMPQAGVAVGMALVAGDHFPELRQEILSVTIASTIVFEIGGPILTQMALRRVTSG